MVVKITPNAKNISLFHKVEKRFLHRFSFHYSIFFAMDEHHRSLYSVQLQVLFLHSVLFLLHISTLFSERKKCSFILQCRKAVPPAFLFAFY